MGPQQRRRGEDVGRPVAHARVADRPQLRPQREQPEQRHERVHPRLLRVPDQQRGGGAERGGDQAGAAVVELAPEQVERRDHERPRDDRREPDGQLAVAERPHGQPEHQVVQRRVAVAVLQVLEHVVEAQVGLVDADRLVEPDAARHGQAQRQPGGGDAGQDEQRPMLRRRVRLAARGEPAARAEQLGLARAAEAPPERPPRVRFQRLDRLHGASGATLPAVTAGARERAVRGRLPRGPRAPRAVRRPAEGRARGDRAQRRGGLVRARASGSSARATPSRPST